MRLSKWLTHPVLSIYSYLSRKHGFKNEFLQRRLDKHHNLHQKYGHVEEFLLSQSSLVTREHVGPA